MKITLNYQLTTREWFYTLENNEGWLASGRAPDLPTALLRIRESAPEFPQ